jgi:hypothetical protein
MKRILLATAVALMLSACSSTKLTKAEDPGSITPIHSQKLTSNFKRKGIKLEFDCAFGTGAFGMTDAMCSKTDIKAIEVTAYAPSYGNSENNRENAFRVAEMRAKAKLRHFIQEDVSSSQTKQVIAKNIEKANDRIKQRINANEEVSMTDDEATKETNWAVRENTNDTVQTLTETVRVNAAGIMRGVRAVDERIVDRQTVQVTIRWDKDSERASQFFRNQWRSQQ